MKKVQSRLETIRDIEELSEVFIGTASVNFLYGRFSKFVSAVSIQKSIQTPYTFFRKVIRFFWRAKTKKARLHFIIKLFSAAPLGFEPRVS